MFYFYAKLFDNTNNDYIFENPQKNTFSIIKDSTTIKELPNRILAIQYRNSFIINDVIRVLTQRLNIPIVSFQYLYFLIGVTDDVNYRDLAMKHYEDLVASNLPNGLIYFDLFLDKDSSEWDKTKALYLENGGDEENIKNISQILKEFQIQI